MAFKFYGNWGGPGWADGHFLEPGEAINWNGSAIDAVDETFRDHDHDYSNAENKYEASSKSFADKQQYWEDIIKADNRCLDTLRPMIIPMPAAKKPHL